MKKLLFLICTIVIVNSAFAQRTSDFGGFIGGAYYMGDVNKTKLFYSPELAYGASYRYTIDERYALRMSIWNAHLSGKDSDFKSEYQLDRGHEFRSSLTDISLQIEFSFFPYDPENMKHPISPYITSGIAMVVAPGSKTTLANIGVPVGLGVKFNITERLTAGVEWSYRKTFTDYLDKLDLATVYDNPASLSRQRYETANYDWYSFFGLYLMIRVFEGDYHCPAYRSYQ